MEKTALVIQLLEIAERDNAQLFHQLLSEKTLKLPNLVGYDYIDNQNLQDLYYLKRGFFSYAAWCGSIQVIKYCIETFDNEVIKDLLSQDFYSALCAAAYKGKISIVQELLDWKGCKNYITGRDISILGNLMFHAVRGKEKSMLKLLYERNYRLTLIETRILEQNPANRSTMDFYFQSFPQGSETPQDSKILKDKFLTYVGLFKKITLAILFIVGFGLICFFYNKYMKNSYQNIKNLPNKVDLNEVKLCIGQVIKSVAAPSLEK